MLSPISLVVAKLHALRHFKQDGREDEAHLRLSLEASRRFLIELLSQGEIRQVLWNCERLIASSQMKPYRRLEKDYGFSIISGVPIEQIRVAAKNEKEDKDKSRLANFVEKRWKTL